MTQPDHVTSEQVAPEAVNLARLLVSHPNAQKALRASIERQQQEREAKVTRRPSAAPMDCPHCGAPGVVYLTLPSKDGPREYRRKPMTCCQAARRDAAENALHYAMNPNNDALERGEAADQYAKLKDTITAPALLRQLDEHEAILVDVHERVTGLTRAQGGFEPGRWN